MAFDRFKRSSSRSEGREVVDAFLASDDSEQWIQRETEAEAKALASSAKSYVNTKLEDGWRVLILLDGAEVGLLLLTHEDVTDDDLREVLDKPSRGAVTGKETAEGTTFEQADRDKIKADWIAARIQQVHDYRDKQQAGEAA